MELATNILLNNLDLFIMFYLYHGVVDKKPKYNLKAILINTTWGTLNGIFSNYMDASTMKFIIYLSIFGFIWYLSREKFYDTFIIFIISFLLFFIIQLLVLLCIQIFPLSFIPKMIIGQLLTVFAVILSCKFPVYRFHQIIKYNMLIKFFFFIITIIAFITLHRDSKFINIISYIPFGIIALIGIYYTLKQIIYYTTKYPSLDHDMRNILTGIYNTVNSNSDLDTIRTEVKNYITEAGIDIEHNYIKTIDERREEIINFINIKKGTKDVKFNTYVQYGVDNPFVPISTVIHMLGILLDNSIEASPIGKAINIYLLYADYDFILEVSNEYEGEFDFSKFNKKRFSTKSGNRGYGLSNLSKIVKKHKGEMQVVKYYKRLKIIIKISI